MNTLKEATLKDQQELEEVVTNNGELAITKVSTVNGKRVIHLQPAKG
jgi:hypothetical protein